MFLKKIANLFPAFKQISKKSNIPFSPIFLGNFQKLKYKPYQFSTISAQKLDIQNPMEAQQYKNDYLFDTYKYQLDTIIKKIETNEKDANFINLYFENTVFHPQGGGQPSDEGFLTYQLENGETKKLEIQSLEYNRGLEVVLHKVKKEILEAEHSELKEGSKISLQINEEKRKIFARIHSGGHLLDMAVGKLKYDWQPGKGYHFEKGPYVEYFGELSADKIEETKNSITQVCQQMIEESQVEDVADVKMYKYEDAQKIMTIPDYIPYGVDFRYVKLSSSDEGCPCGGTHVKHIKEIERVIVTKIKVNQKKGTIVVSYSVNPVEVQENKQAQQKQSNNNGKKKEKKEKKKKNGKNEEQKQEKQQEQEQEKKQE